MSRHPIKPNSTQHRILLGLRAAAMTQEQLGERFTNPSNALTALARAGLVEKPSAGKKGEYIRITQAGRALVAPDGPLSRSATEIVFCQL